MKGPSSFTAYVAIAVWLFGLASLIARIEHATAHSSVQPADLVALLGPEQRPRAIGAVVGPSGHWRLANGRGEVLTAADASELSRAWPILLGPGMDKGEASPPLSIVVDDESVEHAALRLDELPRQATLHVASGGRTYRLLRPTAAGSARAEAVVDDALTVEVGRAPDLREMLWQLRQPMDAATLRLLALEPNASRTLPPKRGASPSNAIVVDPIDPYGLAKALPALARQTVIVSGRLAGELLYFVPSAGSERSVLVGDLRLAAAASDIRLVVLDTRPPHQPGGRTWALQRIGVSGLETAAQRPTLAEFLGALSRRHGQLRIRSEPAAAGSFALRAIPPGQESASTEEGRGVKGTLREALSHVSGDLMLRGVEVRGPDRGRIEELGRRLLPGIPAVLQYGYLLLLALGAAAWPVARALWSRIWPPEVAADYGKAGYLAARSVRAGLFWAVFVPLAAPLTFPIYVLSVVAGTLKLLLRTLGRPARRQTSQPARPDL